MEQSALIEACTGPWLYIEVLSYDEDHGSYFTIDTSEVRILKDG